MQYDFWHPRFGVALGLLLAFGSLAATQKKPKPTGRAPRYSFKELIWREEFDYTGLPDSSKWGYDVGGHGWGNQEQQLYTKARRENARVEHGHLVIEARREALNDKNAYTSARLVSKAKGGGSLTYGRVEVRAQLPAARGTWPAIWMLPDDWKYGDKSWPDNGEIDIMEYVGYRPGIVQASTHCRKYYFRTNNQKTDSVAVPTAPAAFHVYALEWTPETITAFVDNQPYFTSRNEHSGWQAWPWDHPFHLLLNVAVGGEWGGRKGIDQAAFPQQMRVDYVRYYRLNKTNPAALAPPPCPKRPAPPRSFALPSFSPTPLWLLPLYPLPHRPRRLPRPARPSPATPRRWPR